MDTAFKALGDRFLAQTEHLHADWTLVREYPLSEQLLALSHVWRSPDGGDYVIAAKGAPEAIADLCHLDEAALPELSRARSRAWPTRACACSAWRARVVPRRARACPPEQHDFDFEFLGLVGLAGPVRPDRARPRSPSATRPASASS